jgi:hypothetical protein
MARFCVIGYYAADEVYPIHSAGVARHSHAAARSAVAHQHPRKPDSRTIRISNANIVEIIALSAQ